MTQYSNAYSMLALRARIRSMQIDADLQERRARAIIEERDAARKLYCELAVVGSKTQTAQDVASSMGWTNLYATAVA